MPRKPTTIATVQRARDRFLSELRAIPNVTRAALLTDFGREWFYDQRRADPEFREQWDAALEQGVDGLEDEAVRRGHDGVQEPVVNGGRVAKNDDGSVLYRTIYSDTLLLASLKRRRPEHWRDRSTVDTNVKAEVEIIDSPRERLASRIAVLASRASAPSDPGGPDGEGSGGS